MVCGDLASEEREDGLSLLLLEDLGVSVVILLGDLLSILSGDLVIEDVV